VVIHLPDSLQVFSHPWVLGIALALYAIEFLADKIPLSIRLGCFAHVDPPTAAALLAYGPRCSAGRWRWSAGAFLAGGVALTSHSTKASTELRFNTIPEPFSNVATQLGEVTRCRSRLTWIATVSSHRYDCVVTFLIALADSFSFHLFRFLSPVLAAPVRRESGTGICSVPYLPT